MPHVHFHDLRHSCASILIGLGVDLYTVSKILGHGSVSTTQRYAHLQVDQQRAALEKLGNLALVPAEKAACIAPRFAPEKRSGPEGPRNSLISWWVMQGLNLRPLPCEGSALPLS